MIKLSSKRRVAVFLASSVCVSVTAQAQLEEIVVTATKREGVTVQDVAASISVFDAQLLENADVESLTDLTQLSPSLIAVQTQNPSSTRIGLRGLSTPANNVGFEAAVGVSIDGVARSRTGIALSELPELASVEVLRGPQGTLFGRNTSAGVININTAKPNPEGGGYLSLSAGNFGAATVQGAINFALSNEWVGRIDAKYRENDGFLDDVNSESGLNSTERTALRGQFIKDGESRSWRVIADYATSDSGCCGAVVFQQGPSTALPNALARAAGNTAFGSADIDDLQVAITPDNRPSDDVTDFGLSVEYNRDINGLNLSSITAYRDWESDVTRDGDLSGADFVNTVVQIENSSLSQELRLQGEKGALNWLVGAYYLRDEVENSNTVIPGSQFSSFVDNALAGATTGLLGRPFQAFGTLPTLLQAGPFGVPSIQALTNPFNPSLAVSFVAPTPTAAGAQNLTTDAIALFTHNEIALSDQWKATLGLRYTNEDKDIDFVNTSNESGLSSEGCRVQGALARVNPGLAQLAGLTCLPLSNILFDGAGSGGRSDDALSGTLALSYAASEDVLLYASYSRGFKSGGFNLDRAGFSLASGASANDLEFDAEEVDAFEFGWNTTFSDGSVTFNGAVFYQDVADFQQLNFTGLNFEVATSDFEVSGVELDLIARPLENLSLQFGYAYTDAEDQLTGQVPNAQPENSLNAAATLILPVSQSIVGSFHLNARYNDEIRLFNGVPANGIEDFQSSSTIVNSRVTLASKEGSWAFSIFADNLTDEIVKIAMLN